MHFSLFVFPKTDLAAIDACICLEDIGVTVSIFGSSSQRCWLRYVAGFGMYPCCHCCDSFCHFKAKNIFCKGGLIFNHFLRASCFPVLFGYAFQNNSNSAHFCDDGSLVVIWWLMVVRVSWVLGVSRMGARGLAHPCKG